MSTELYFQMWIPGGETLQCWTRYSDSLWTVGPDLFKTDLLMM